MQTYDLLMIGVLVAAGLFGFWKGMAWQIASLASLIVSYFAALKFADQLAPMISNHAPWNKFVAMLAIYIGTSFVIWTIFRMVSGVIDKVRLESFDRQLGGLFGLAKGALLCIAITFFAVTILPQAQKDMIIASRTGEYIVRALDHSETFVPPEIHEVIHPYVERIEQRLNPNGQSNQGNGFQVQWPRNEQGFPQLPDASSLWPSQSADNAEQPAPRNVDNSNWNQPAASPVDTQPQTADRNLGNAY